MFNMKLLVCLLLFGVAKVLANKYGPVSIVGGSNAAMNGYPYQISMQSTSGSHFCGGSLVRAGNGEIVVVSAAHCLADGTTASSIQIKVGEHTLNKDNENNYEKVYTVKKIVLHPGYNANTLSNDIAVLFLNEPVQVNDGVKPIAITDKPSVKWFNQDCVITGWGTLAEGGELANVLQQATVDFFSDVKCTQDYGSEYLKHTMICGGKRKGGIDACQGDSGGPFACKDGDSGDLVLSGITSWGRGCARPGKAGIYTDLYMMRGWLDSRLGL